VTGCVAVMLFLTHGAFPWDRRCLFSFVHLVRRTVGWYWCPSHAERLAYVIVGEKRGPWGYGVGCCAVGIGMRMVWKRTARWGGRGVRGCESDSTVSDA